MESSTAANDAPLRLVAGGVRISADEVAQVDDRGHPVLRIPRTRIQQIDLRWGRQAARPFLQLILGLLFFAGGCFIEIRMLVEWLLHGGVLHGEVVVGLVILVLLGAWLLWTSLRRGYFLEVQTGRRAEKVCFARGLAKEEIEAFLEEARMRLGVQITRSTLGVVR